MIELDQLIGKDIYKYKDAFTNNRKNWSTLFSENLPDTADYLIGVENYQLIRQVWLEKFRETGLRQSDHHVEYIKLILGKILIPDSIFPTLENARFLASKVPNNKNHCEI